MGAIVHIGYHKTGTTWFQERFYPAVRNRRYVPRATARAAFLQPGALHFDPIEALHIIGAAADETILCEENLSGGLHNGGLAGALSKDVASRIARTLPDAQIVIFVRDPLSAIASAWVQYVKGGGTFGLRRYLFGRDRLSPVAPERDEPPGFCFEHFDYARLIAEMGEKGGATSYDFRRMLAAKAYAATAAYDSMIASWFAFADQGVAFPETLSLASKLGATLRYGENPHQSAALYLPVGPSANGIAQARQIQGKDLSYNNYNDADAALELVSEFRDGPPTVVIVKHANPCGVATGDTLIEAYEAALACDSVSAFGGIIAVNRPLDGPTAEAISGIFTEVVAAPDADDDAKAIFAKKKNLRLLLTGDLPDPARPGLQVKSIAGGMLVQGRDNGRVTQDMLKTVTKRAPSEQELKDCLFAWTVAKHVKSNAIVYARGGSTAGVGAGQMNRLESARIAAWKAKDAAEKAGWAQPRTIGSAVASDAFFPFADGLLAAVEAGATAVIQPGGSIRDDEVIAAADERGLAMVFTGMRHFRH